MVASELEWEDAKDGVGLIEIASKQLCMWIEPIYGDSKYTWMLYVGVQDNGLEYERYAFLRHGYAERKCVDLKHAWHLADAFEREINRRLKKYDPVG